jgi:hypothetical protein
VSHFPRWATAVDAHCAKPRSRLLKTARVLHGEHGADERDQVVAVGEDPDDLGWLRISRLSRSPGSLHQICRHTALRNAVNVSMSARPPLCL